MADRTNNILKLAGYGTTSIPNISRSTYSPPDRTANILALAGYAPKNSSTSSAFAGHPLAGINPALLEPEDFTRQRLTSAPLTIDELRGEREAYATRAQSIYDIEKKAIDRSIATTGTPKFSQRTDLEPLKGVYRTGRPGKVGDWRSDNSLQGLARREQFAMTQAALAGHQYEQRTGRKMSQEDYIAQRDYYREQAGLGGPNEYFETQMQTQAEAQRPEDLGLIEEGKRAAGRASKEIAQGIAGGIGMIGGLAGSAGADWLAEAAQKSRQNIRLTTSRQLRQSGNLASQEATQLWNPSSPNWWVNTGVTRGIQMAIPVKGGAPGQALMGLVDAGNVFEQIVAQGGDTQKAAQIASVYGVGAAMMERWGAKVLLTDKKFSSGLYAAIYKSLSRGGIEGAQEGTALISEYLGTQKMPENVWQRMVQQMVVSGAIAGASAPASHLNYGDDSGVRPRMATDFEDVRVGPKLLRVPATAEAADLPEAIRNDPKAMRVQIHSILRNALGDKQKAVEVQRQLAYEMFGKNRAAGTEADPMLMMGKPLGDAEAVKAAIEEQGGEYKGIQVDENEQPAWHVITDPNSKHSAIMVKDATDVVNQIGNRQQKFEAQKEFHLRDIDDPAQLAEIYDQARLYQPVGIPKVKDNPSMNASLDRLVRRMNDDQTLTADEFHTIMTDLGLRGKGGPKALMSESQAWQLRRTLQAQEQLGGQESRLAAQRSLFTGVDEVLTDYEKSSASYRAKQESTGKKSFGKIRDFQSTRHWAAQLDDITGLPIRRQYDAVVERYHEALYGKSQWMQDTLSSHRKAAKILGRKGPDADRVREAIKTGKMKGLSEPEIAVAEKIRQQFKDAEIEIKIRELHDYIEGRYEGDIDPAILERAEREYDERGYQALYDIAASEDFGVRKNYYPKYAGQEKKSIYQDLSRYYDKVHAANIINPDLNAFNVLVERATKMQMPDTRDRAGSIANPHAQRRSDTPFGESRYLKDPTGVVKGAIAFNHAIRHIDVDQGGLGRAFNYLTNKAMNAYYVTQLPTIRNTLQVLSEDQNLNLRQSFDLLRRMSPEDKEFLHTYARQDKGIQEQLAMIDGPLGQLPVLRQYQAGVRAASSTFLAADRQNRKMSMVLSLARTRAAIAEAGPDWKDSKRGIYQVIHRSGVKARFDDTTIRRAVEELATGGEDAFTRYLALQHTLDVQGTYHLAERSVNEMKAGPLMRKLASWPRMKAELYGRAVHTLGSSRSTAAAKDQAAVSIVHMMLTNWAAGVVYNKLTGVDSNPYDITKTLTFIPGGFGPDLWDRLNSTAKIAAQAILDGDWDKAWQAGEVVPNQFVAGYASIKRIWEATELSGPVKLKGNREAGGASLVTRIKHVLTGKAYQQAADIRTPQKLERMKKLKKRPTYVGLED